MRSLLLFIYTTGIIAIQQQSTADDDDDNRESAGILKDWRFVLFIWCAILLPVICLCTAIGYFCFVLYDEKMMKTMMTTNDQQSDLIK
jgi:hypothetical protein